MPYRIINSDGELIDIPVKVKPDENHKLVYAHGALGGFLANYHFRIDFYQDAMPLLNFTETDGKLIADSVEDGVERKIMFSVYLPLSSVKELRNWLDKNIKQFEQDNGEIKLMQAEIDEANVKDK